MGASAPRTNTFGAVARLRNQVSMSIHAFFQEEGFLYVHTPIITASDCEGAGELFRVTTLDLDDLPRKDGVIDFSRDFFDRPSFLTVSGQLEAEIFATALGKVYTFGPTFRAENSNTSRHLAEFWMVEPEMAFYDLFDNMDLAERFLKRIIRDVLEHCLEDMAFFNQRIDNTVIETLQKITRSDFVRVTYTEAVEMLQQSGVAFEFPLSWGSDLQSEHERYLTEKKFDGPVILYDYPAAIKPFYMRVNDDQRTVRAMDVLVPKVGEIIGGSQREERLDVLTARMRAARIESGGLLVVRRPAQVRHRATRRFRTGVGTDCAVCHWYGQHPRRHPFSPHAGKRRVLRRSTTSDLASSSSRGRCLFRRCRDVDQAPYVCTITVLLRVRTILTRNPQHHEYSVIVRPNSPRLEVTQGASVQQPGTQTGISIGQQVHGS